METLLFHERDELLEGVCVVVKLITSGVKVELPLGEHEAIESVFDFRVGGEKMSTAGTREVLRHLIDETKAAGNVETSHMERLGSAVKVFLLNEKRVRRKTICEKETNVVVKKGIRLLSGANRGEGVIPGDFEVTSEDLASFL